VKLAAYTRVSTDRQAEQGFGLPIQKETIGRWARNSGHTIVSWHEDAGQSGAADLSERLGLGDALDACKEGKARGVVVARLDRLARDLVIQETIIGVVRRGKGRVYSCAPGEDAMLDDDDTDPSRKLVRQVMGAVAEYERSVIRMRMAAGRARKKAAGGHSVGRPGYGWRAVDGELVPEPVEQTQIELMRSLRASGASYGHIAIVLERLEVPTAVPGSRWQNNTVRRILERVG
jgi:DNA invertase Pin-like site-specific DNA recombinase